MSGPRQPTAAASPKISIIEPVTEPLAMASTCSAPASLSILQQSGGSRRQNWRRILRVFLPFTAAMSSRRTKHQIKIVAETGGAYAPPPLVRATATEFMDNLANVGVLPVIKDFLGRTEQVACRKTQVQVLVVPSRD
jgi:hypothetical protein